MSIWLTEKNKTLIWKYHFYEHHYAKPDFAEYSKWCWRTTALPLFSTLPIVYKSIRIEPIPNLLSDYDILVGMTRVCRNVTNQVTLELVVEAMCLGYNYKKMHILTEKLWTCPSAGFSPHYFSCYFRLCTDGKKKITLSTVRTRTSLACWMSTFLLWLLQQWLRLCLKQRCDWSCRYLCLQQGLRLRLCLNTKRRLLRNGLKNCRRRLE